MEEMSVVVGKINKDVKSLHETIMSLSVVDETTNTNAAELLGGVKARMKRIEELRTSFVKPLNDQVKLINNTFKKESEPLEVYEEKIKNEMKIYYLTEQKRLQEDSERRRTEFEASEKKRIEEEERLKKEKETATIEEQEKLDELIKEMSVPTVQEVVEMPKQTVRATTATVSMKTVWKYEITDQDALMKAYPQFFIPDAKKIQEFVMNSRVEGERDGLRMYQDTIIASR